MSFYPAKGGGKSKRKYLYNAGDECTALTGGWKAYPYGGGSWTALTSFTKNSDNMYLATGTNQALSVGPTNKIDLTDIDFIEVESEELGSASEAPEIRLYSADSGAIWGNPNGISGRYTMQSGKKARVLDVSNVTGSCYITICAYNNGKTKIKSVSMK